MPGKAKAKSLTPEEHRARVLALAGKYAGIAPSVDDYLREKHAEHRAEEGRKRHSCRFSAG